MDVPVTGVPSRLVQNTVPAVVAMLYPPSWEKVADPPLTLKSTEPPVAATVPLLGEMVTGPMRVRDAAALTPA